MSNTTTIDGHALRVSPNGVLIVDNRITVLPRGTHVALDSLGLNTKRQIVSWWRRKRICLI